MAKQNILIEGAGKVYGSKGFVDPGKAFAAGAAIVAQPISPKQSALASMSDTDKNVKAYLNSLKSDVDLLGLAEAEQSSIKSYLFNQKMRFSQLANQIVQTDATSPEYLKIKNEMDGIKSSFSTLGDQVDLFKKRKIQYLDDLDKGRLSKGNKAEDYNLAGKVYGGGALSINPGTGEIEFFIDGGKGLVKYSDVNDPFLKDFKVADQILTQGNTLYEAGVPLNIGKENVLRNRLTAMLSQDGALESVVEDGLINNQRLNIDIDAYETREDAIKGVTEMLLQGYRDTANAGAAEKRRKQQGGKGIETDTDVKDYSVAIDALGNLLNTGEYEGKNSVSFTYKRPNYDQRTEEYTIQYFPKGPSSITIGETSRGIGGGLYYKKGGALSKWMYLGDSTKDINEFFGQTGGSPAQSAGQTGRSSAQSVPNQTYQPLDPFSTSIDELGLQ